MRNCQAFLLIVLFVMGSASGLSAREKGVRRQDDRAPVDATLAEKNGIQRYDSKFLILYTDIEPEKARELVGLVDQVYPAWEAFFGKLPPARDKSPFQITGFLMRDPTRFQNANLLRVKSGAILHGKSEGYEFWMNDQSSDYYRAHLLLHEATHCFTMCYDAEPKSRPHWFLEGIAEYFGTHEATESGSSSPSTLQFGVIASSEEKSLGFGRIEMIHAECEAGRSLSAEEVQQLGIDVFAESRTTPYAWSWAFCTFLALHPLTADEFQKVCQQSDPARFQRVFKALWKKHQSAIEADWELFRNSLCYGYDLRRGATKRTAVTPLRNMESRAVIVPAAGGWQSTGIQVTSGQTLLFKGQGRVTLAETTKPWISEPNGISIRYAEGKPMGRLLAAVERTTPAGTGPHRYWEFHEVGAEGEWKVPESGVLYLRVNDRWNELSDNSGEYQVTVTSRE